MMTKPLAKAVERIKPYEPKTFINKKKLTNLITVPINREMMVCLFCLKVIHVEEIIGAIVSVRIVKHETANNSEAKSKFALPYMM